MAFLVDAGWIEAIASIVAVILTLIIYRITRNKKSLSYEVLTESPLISISDEIKGKLQVRFNGRPVENIHLLLVKFVNDGNVPISASDYERPLMLRFMDDSSIISAEKVQTTPGNLNPSINTEDQTITVEPIMLNASDTFTVKILISQYSGNFDVDARVLGVKAIHTPPKSDRKIKVWLAVSAAMFVLTIITLAMFVQLSGVKRFLFSGTSLIGSLVAQRDFLRPDDSTFVRGVVSGFSQGVKYEWSAVRGNIYNIGRDDTVIYKAPAMAGRDIVTLKITDESGRSDIESIFITISLDAPSQNQTNQMPSL